jgi:hypothetical protein
MTVTFLSLRYRSVAKATVQDGGAGPAVVSERLNGDQATPEQIGPADACHRGATRTSPALFRECITLHAAGQHPAMTSSPWPIRTGLRSEELREGGCEARLAGLIRGLEVYSRESPLRKRFCRRDPYRPEVSSAAARHVGCFPGPFHPRHSASGSSSQSPNEFPSVSSQTARYPNFGTAIFESSTFPPRRATSVRLVSIDGTPM